MTFFGLQCLHRTDSFALIRLSAVHIFRTHPIVCRAQSFSPDKYRRRNFPPAVLLIYSFGGRAHFCTGAFTRANRAQLLFEKAEAAAVAAVVQSPGAGEAALLQPAVGDAVDACFLAATTSSIYLRIQSYASVCESPAPGSVLYSAMRGGIVCVSAFIRFSVLPSAL